MLEYHASSDDDNDHTVTLNKPNPLNISRKNKRKEERPF